MRKRELSAHAQEAALVLLAKFSSLSLKMSKPPPAKKQRLGKGSGQSGSGKHQREWESATFEKGKYFKLIKSSEEGPEFTFCIPCKKSVKVAASGVYDLRAHFDTKRHKDNVDKCREFRPINVHFQPQQQREPENAVTKAEVMFCQFMAEHNLPPLVADHFTELVKKMFPDSKIAQGFSCKRTKATQIVKGCLAPAYTEPVIDRMRHGPFTLMIDESNDKQEQKRLAILARVIEGGESACAKTRILDLPIPKGGTAQAIFDEIDNFISAHNIPWENMVGFASDNCNVMLGANNSVLSRLKEKNPSIFSIGCICHLANLCVKAAVKQLRVPVDQLLVDIFYFFEHSSKRKDDYKEFQIFTDVDELEILKHCPTRWLSLEKVCKRMINQLPALKSYFESHSEVEKPGKVRNINTSLQDPETELTLHFLCFVLPIINKFNTIFQAEESKIGCLLPEMNRLLAKLLHKFVLLRHVRDCDDLRVVDYTNRENQHSDENIAIGMPAQTFLESEELITPRMRADFFLSVRAFYQAAVKKMMEKFPFTDRVLPDLVVLDPSKRADVSYDKIYNLSEHFLPGEVDLEELKEEWEDYQLMSESTVDAMLVADNGTCKKIDVFFSDLLSMKTSLGRVRFPEMTKVYTVLLSLPHSNADCERVFSMLRKIHTDFRKRLSPDTLTAFLQVKINCDKTCYDVQCSDALLCKAKSATKEYNAQHQ